MRRILITGSNGFIGKNLAVRLGELPAFEVIRFDRTDALSSLQDKVSAADAIIHLAGVNRPENPEEFTVGNADLTARLCDAIRASGRRIPLVLTSSIQAELDNPYGVSKRAAELAAQQLADDTGNPVAIYRLPNVFGKWCRPNYNSVVATFCHNLARGLPIQINNPVTELRLVYVDDIVAELIDAIDATQDGLRWGQVQIEYGTTLGELADQIGRFANCRTNLVTERVGTGLTRALYATYLSYLEPQSFSYTVPAYGDDRGVFVEMLKTPDSGQFSFFTAHPGITRGGHYHHSKTEKFLVLKGEARFGFRHILSNETFDLQVSGDKPTIVETVPGWTHDITNVGNTELVVMLWANEIFDREKPDTVALKV